MISAETGFVAGPYDLIGVMRDTHTGRYHAAVWVDKPLPGNPNLGVVSLNSWMHHTEGAESFEGALEHVRALREKISIHDSNVWLTVDKVIERDFRVQGPVSVLVLPKWR